MVDSQRKMLVGELLSQPELLFVDTMNKRFRRSVHHLLFQSILGVDAGVDAARPAFVFYDGFINLLVVYATLKQSARILEGFSLRGVSTCKQHPIFSCTLLRAMHNPYLEEIMRY